MSDQKPLHIQVHEALGRGAVWRPGRPPCAGCGNKGFDGWWEKTWDETGEPDYFSDDGQEVPRYDLDWKATGPLVQRMRLALWCYDPEWAKVDPEPRADAWRTNSHDNGLQLEGSETGPTALLAVCAFILALKAAGKL